MDEYNLSENISPVQSYLPISTQFFKKNYFFLNKITGNVFKAVYIASFSESTVGLELTITVSSLISQHRCHYYCPQQF